MLMGMSVSVTDKLTDADPNVCMYVLMSVTDKLTDADSNVCIYV